MSKRQKYFMEQKLIGLGMIILGIISTILLDGDITACVILVPAGIGLFVTKSMVLVNNYYYEIEDRRNRRR